MKRSVYQNIGSLYNIEILSGAEELQEYYKGQATISVI